MPHYLFNIRIGDALIEDPDGRELRDPDQAWEAARALARDLLRDHHGRRDVLAAAVEVMDDAGEVVLEFPVLEALDPTATH